MKTLCNDYRDTPRRSCRPYDAPTGERRAVTIGDKTVVRTVYERRSWRNSGQHKLVARFVIVDGVRYVVD